MQIQTVQNSSTRPRAVGGGASHLSLPPASSGGRVAVIDAVASTTAIAREASRAELPLPVIRPGAGNAAFFEPGLQQQIAAGQQGLAWLDELGSQLQQLKKALSLQLAGSPVSTGAADSEAALRRFGTALQQRSSKAGGVVDGQLRVVEAGQARQGFALRGLELAALNNEGAETLSFAVPGTPAPVAVTLDPAETAEALVRRLDQALAPTGVRAQIVAADGGGEMLNFSCAEDQWPALREGLSIKGEGRRFPSGQRVRVRLDAEPEALQPARWSLAGAQAQRQTLGRVIAAQARLGEARAALQQQTAERQLPAAVDALDQGQALLAFARDFDGAAVDPGSYARLNELLPALSGVRREHVQQLLLKR